MPSKRARGDLERALRALTAALDSVAAPWMIIGGIAVIARGVRRFTTDIDAAVRGDAVTIERLMQSLARKKIDARIPDAESFARENLVLLMRHRETGVDLDISLAWSAFELEALDAAEEVAFGRARAPMSSPADLVVFKSIAGRPRDMDDVEALLLLHPKLNRRRARKRIVELAELAGAPELVQLFDAAVTRAAGVISAPKRPPRR